MNTHYDIIIIGGGPAGMGAALGAYEAGARSILILERDTKLGGILGQCIHAGFGLDYFKEELTGPEYALRFIELLKDTDIAVKLDTMVLGLTPGEQHHTVTAVNPQDGYMELRARAVVLAMGCRERTRGALRIPGTRPEGVLTAGTAQRLINLDGRSVGKRAVILGSGDIGLIMARRLTLEGAKVLAVLELMPYSNGLTRNLVQCLDDFGIPLYLSHTVTNIEGFPRLSRVTASRVDEQKRPIPGSEITFDCDTLLLSVGLIPENELTRGAKIGLDPKTGGAFVYEDMQTTTPGIFACGNVLKVHDLADFVTREAYTAGKGAADYVRSGNTNQNKCIKLVNGDGIGYVSPQYIKKTDQPVTISFRVTRPCYDRELVLSSGGSELLVKAKEYMLPAEMERLIIPPKLLNQAGDTIELTVREDK